MIIFEQEKNVGEIIHNYSFWAIISFFSSSWTILSYIINVRHMIPTTRVSRVIDDLIKLFLFHFCLYHTVVGLFDINLFSEREAFIIYFLMITFITLWRMFVIYALKKYRRSGYNFTNVIIVGVDETSEELVSFFNEHPEHGFRLKRKFRVAEIPSIDNIKEFCLTHEIDEVYCNIPRLSTDMIKDLISFCDNNLIRIKFLPDSKGYSYKKLSVNFYDLIPVLSLRPSPLDIPLNRIAKRLFDIAFSLTIIVCIFLPITFILSILIKLESKGPVFFKQKRTGIDNRDFWCYKFRSMTVNEDSDDKQATKGDMRITKIGAFIRKTSIDELPQFINVLFGDMSIVGPRPHMLKHTEEYSALIDKFMVRHFVKPGITGLSQIMGYRGETKELYKMKNRIKLDIFYVENWSFWLDIRIIAQTVLDIFKKDEEVF
ncbi:MAG: undecaprenyl-phosphate glucose phosphotransferase [Cytophagales bacterium]|nr:undecaprenyl-phosphate glucose phosphotransferase [Cytophagales bacterium]